VVIPLVTQHYAMRQRNLFYTGITRANLRAQTDELQRRAGPFFCLGSSSLFDCPIFRAPPLP